LDPSGASAEVPSLSDIAFLRKEFVSDPCRESEAHGISVTGRNVGAIQHRHRSPSGGSVAAVFAHTTATRIAARISRIDGV
jgi:hypothetical protein